MVKISHYSVTRCVTSDYSADNHGGVAQDSVYQSILMSGWEVSKAAQDMSVCLKNPLVSQHNGTSTRTFE